MRAAMCTLSLLALLLVLPLSLAQAEEENRDERVKALLAAVEQATRKAKPSIASILVSTSEEYHTAPYWGERAPEDQPGKLGGFDVAAALAKVPAGARHRARIEATIRDHDLSNPSTVPESYGSGFVVAPGFVLTNSHVVKNATKIYVRLFGNKGSWADIHAADPRSDLAVLRLLDKVPDVQPLKLGKGEKVKEGQALLTLVGSWSSEFPDDPVTTSWGVVSGLRRRAPGRPNEAERSKITLHHYGTLIQTDGRIQPNCSGGALLDLAGEVVGLTTALVTIRGADSSGALAIPFDINTRRIIEVLIQGKEVEYGFLGVVLALQGKGGPGVRIQDVASGSPAARAGLMPQDLILSVDDQPVRDNDELFLHVGMGLAGHNVRVEFARGFGGARRTVDIKLAKFYVPGPVIAVHRPPAYGGLRVDYSSILTQRGLLFTERRTFPEGVVIREVIPHSSADKNNLQPDKVITQVNGKAVASPEDYYREMDKAVKSSTGKVELTILNSENRPEQVELDLK